jgi:hypothetical protein
MLFHAAKQLHRPIRDTGAARRGNLVRGNAVARVVARVRITKLLLCLRLSRRLVERRRKGVARTQQSSHLPNRSVVSGTWGLRLVISASNYCRQSPQENLRLGIMSGKNWSEPPILKSPLCSPEARALWLAGCPHLQSRQVVLPSLEPRDKARHSQAPQPSSPACFLSLPPHSVTSHYHRPS